MRGAEAPSGRLPSKPRRWETWLDRPAERGRCTGTWRPLPVKHCLSILSEAPDVTPASDAAEGLYTK